MCSLFVAFLFQRTKMS